MVHCTANGKRSADNTGSCLCGCNWGAETEARGVISIYHYIHLFKKGAKEFFSLGKVKSMSHVYANHGERCMLTLLYLWPKLQILTPYMRCCLLFNFCSG